jgi:hypothetical protein
MGQHPESEKKGVKVAQSDDFLPDVAAAQTGNRVEDDGMSVKGVGIEGEILVVKPKGQHGQRTKGLVRPHLRIEHLEAWGEGKLKGLNSFLVRTRLN